MDLTDCEEMNYNDKFSEIAAQYLDQKNSKVIGKGSRFEISDFI